MLAYLFVRVCISFFKLIPFILLEYLAKFLKFSLQYIIRYRRSTVESNLRRCFPELLDHEISKISSQSYQNLSNIILEGIKGLSLSREEMMERNQILGLENITDLLSNDQSIILVCPHYYNWEWTVLSTGYYLPNRMIGIYKEIKNPRIEKYIYKLRARCSMNLISTRETREIIHEIPKGRAILLMSDQSPSNMKDAIWVDFFNERVPVLHGLEKYASSYKLPVFYLDQIKLAPNKYRVEICPLFTDFNHYSYGTISQAFMSKVEHVIRHNPSPWLWSHRRWKHL